MKVLIACLVAITITKVAEALEDGLVVKFGTGTNPEEGTDYFYRVARNISEAVTDGWRQTRRPSGPLPELVMYCPPDKVVCAFYDDSGDVAGLQIALHRNSFTNNVFDWEKRGFSLWNTAVGGQCRTMWTLQQFFVSAESLKRSKEERLAARNPSRVLQENAVWLTGTNGDLLRISTKESDIVEQGLFTEQTCLPWMGQHYYYNMSSTTPCDEENMYPWFPLATDGELIATGFVTFGNLHIEDGMREWFETPPPSVVSEIVPRGPQCVYNLSENPGAITLHIYYTSTPWLITC